MSGWDGNGNFVMPYSMVQQAGAGVKILSTVQDAQWNAVAAGLMNCMTLDSQTKPKADVDIATHKLINVSAPAAATDAANKSYVDTAVAGVQATEWLAESNGVAWVNTTSFSVAGVNVTAIYHPGRRVKITHNTGGTVSYGTVVSSAFGVNTTVVVAIDGGTALVSTVTAVSYGLISYVNPSYLDPRTTVIVSSKLNYTWNNISASIPFDNIIYDALGEYVASPTYGPVVQHPGVYIVTGSAVIIVGGGGSVVAPIVDIFFGVATAGIQTAYAYDGVGITWPANTILSVTATQILYLNAGGFVHFNLSLGSSSGGANLNVGGSNNGYSTYMMVTRIA